MPSKREVRHQPAVDPHYAYLGLHHAALSGNVGLVQYALSEGQPVDAVWDGISALHAAAAGGSEHVARLLIDSGADVNFGRQLKNERDVKARTASSSSISPPLDKSDMLGPPHAAESLLNPGSTPLHFACAHNNIAVARLLLAHGAAPHIPDKRGVTPLDLLPPASASSPIPTPTSPSSDHLRTVIREYYENEKAKEKEFQKNQIRFYGKAAAVLGFPRNDDDNKRVVGGRHSVEHLSRSPKQAQAQLTSPKHVPVPIPTASPARRGIPSIASPPPSPRRLQPTSPSDRDRTIPSPPPPSAGYTFGCATVAPTTNPAGWTSTSASTSVPFIPTDQRRPSLPHIFETPTPSSRSTHTPASTSPSFSRPRSADGTDAPVFGNGAPSSSSSSPRMAAHSTLPTFSSSSAAVPLANTRPRTKRSLLSLFKRFDTPCDKEKDAAERDAARGRPSFSSGIGMGLGLGISSLSPTRHQTQHREEIHTAPAEQTTFASSAYERTRVRVPEDVFCDDDVFEDYGVPLRQMMDGSEPIVPPVLMPDPEPDPDPDPAFDARGQRGQNGDAEGNQDGEEYSSDDDGEDTVEERTSTDTKRAGPIPIPARHAHAEGTSLGLRLGGSSVGSDTPSPPSAPPLPPSLLTPPPTLPPTSAARSSPRPRPGILRGDSSAVRRSGSKGALRFEGTSLRESESRGSLRERGGGSLREAGGTGPVLREKGSGSSLSGQGVLGVAVGGCGDSRLRGDSLSSAVSHASYDTSMASASTTASIPSLDPDTARGSYSSDEDDEDEDDEPEMSVPELGLNIRTVSNHAQAEALVQKAAKEILELSAFSEGSNLSAQLAAYGETLQLERRFARGEVRRVMSPTRARFGDGVEQDGGGGGEEEEGEVVRKKTQEKTMVHKKSMERYARGVSRERRSTEGAKERERMGTGYALERTTSLEKEVGTEEAKKPKKPRSPKLRRPHTSDSVASAASGSTAPPRFGYSSRQSSGTFLRSSPGEQGRRVHHQMSHSTSVHFPPRSESLDYGTRMAAVTPEMEDGEGGVPHATHATTTSGSNRSPFGQSSISPSPLMPATGSPFMASTVTVDEFGTSGRPLKQRLGGGLRSLFGKNK